MQRRSFFISRSKILALCVITLLLAVNLIVTVLSYSLEIASARDTVVGLSRLAVCQVAICIVLWGIVTHEWLNGFLVFYIVAVLFCMGQAFGWAFDIEMGDFDLMNYVPSIPLDYIVHSLLFSLDGMTLLFAGGLIAYKRNESKLNNGPTAQNDQMADALSNVSSLMLVIGTPCLFINMANIFRAVAIGGYSQMYVELNSYSQLGQLIPLLAGWVPVALLIKYAISRDKNPTISRISVLCLLVYIALTLYSGGRSGAIMVCIALILAKQFYGNPFTGKTLIICLLAGYFFIAILNAIADVRLTAGYGVTSLFAAVNSSFVSVMGNFFGELGWTMSSLAWTMQLMDHGETLRNGSSYVFAFTAVIPNIGFWDVHPAIIYSDLGSWMQTELGRSTGLGYTFVAEAYANFSWFGLGVLPAIGFILGKMIGRIDSQNAKFNYLESLTVILMFSTLLKPFVRSSFSSIMRPLVFTVLLALGLSLLVRRNNISKTTEGNEELTV